MSEAVPKEVRIDMPDAGLLSSFADRLIDPAVGHLPSNAEPQIRTVSVPSLRSHADISIERLSGPLTKWTGPLASTFSQDASDVIGEVDITYLEPSELRASHPRID